MEHNTNVHELRPIHYLGSKLRMLDTIGEAINSVSPGNGRICDLFSGSGTVSRYFSHSRPVTAVDIQEYSRVLCSAVLMPARLSFTGHEIVSRIKASKEYAVLLDSFEPLLSFERVATEKAKQGDIDSLYNLIANGSVIVAEKGCLPKSQELSFAIQSSLQLLDKAGLSNSVDTMVTRYFGGLYFSVEQAVCIDAALDYIYGQAVDVSIRNTLLAALLGATSEIVNTVGKQFAQPLQVLDKERKPKRKLLKKILDDRALSFWHSFSEWIDAYSSLPPTPFSSHEVLRLDFHDALKQLQQSDVSVVYADPPYTRYHYSRYYHVLETICLRDLPAISPTFAGGTQLSRAIYREGRHQSPFCIRSKAGEAFDDLFAGIAELKVPFVLSYSPFSESSLATPRLQTIEQLLSKARYYYKDVSIVSPGHFMHSKLNAVEKNFEAEQEAELLLVCQGTKG